MAQNYFNHLTVIRRSVVTQVGGLRFGFEGAQDHDLILRVLEVSSPNRVLHIPKILYHWRAMAGSTALAGAEKSYAPVAGRRAVQEHLDRIGVRAVAEHAPENCGHYRVRYSLPSQQPSVTIIIPTRDRSDILGLCLDSVLSRTSYSNFNIIVIDNGSIETDTFELFERQPKDRVQIIRIDEPFNYSRLNNIAALNAEGEFLCFMNNDIEVKSKDWLGEMVSFALQSGVGCVGARLWFPNTNLQHGGVILGIGGVAGHAHKYVDQKSHGYFCRAIHHQSFSAVTAACMIIKRSVFSEVRGFDEELAVAFNDIDLCLRVRDAGYRNIWTPYAELIHHESASRGSEVSEAQRARFNREVSLMKDRWGAALEVDPAYNVNLTLEFEDFSLAWPPRMASAATEGLSVVKLTEAIAAR